MVTFGAGQRPRMVGRRASDPPQPPGEATSTRRPAQSITSFGPSRPGRGPAWAPRYTQAPHHGGLASEPEGNLSGHGERVAHRRPPRSTMAATTRAATDTPVAAAK